MGFRMYRAASVPPLHRGSSAQSHIITSSSRLPVYCPPHGQYYGYHTPVSAPRPSLSTYGSRVSTRPSHSVTSTRYFDLGYPTRTFGNRLSKGYASTSLGRPEIYERAYGVSYLPGYGRDSYSAYKLAGATMDDSDDLMSYSTKRDNQVLRSVENTIENLRAPPTRHTFIRASSVPPRPMQIGPPLKLVRGSARSVRNKPNVVVTTRRAGNNDVYYRVPPPRVQCHYETVNKGSDLLRAKEKMCARECVDLTSPSGTVALRMRLHDAQNALAKHTAMLNRYAPSDDADDAEISAQLRLIKTRQEMRAKSVM